MLQFKSCWRQQIPRCWLLSCKFWYLRSPSLISWCWQCIIILFWLSSFLFGYRTTSYSIRKLSSSSVVRAHISNCRQKCNWRTWGRWRRARSVCIRLWKLQVGFYLYEYIIYGVNVRLCDDLLLWFVSYGKWNADRIMFRGIICRRCL